MDSLKPLEQKAELLSHGRLYIPSEVPIPIPFSRSTAGPSAGSKMIGISFGPYTIKLEVSSEPNELFRLTSIDGQYSIYKGDQNYLSDINIVHIPFHAVNHLFLNIEPRCIHSCKFCNQPYMTQHLQHNYSIDLLKQTIIKGINKYNFDSVAFTSGIYPDNSLIIENMNSLAHYVRNLDTKISIGVEPCINNKSELIALQQNGFSEIKINLQLPTKDLFNLFCPTLDYEAINKLLITAVSLFGRGKVCSNIIFGLGESDSEVIEAIQHLSENGIVPTLRKIRFTPQNYQKITKTLGSEPKKPSAARMISLGRHHKKILQNHDLSTKSFSTMCHTCGCCDLVPFIDF